MPGLCVFKQDPVIIVCLACDDGQTVVIFQIQIFFVYLGHLLNSY